MARSHGAQPEALRRRPPVSGALLWQFHVGSTLAAPPVVAPTGTTYVGTSDGTLQAITEAGTLAWSYSLEGSVAASPILDAAGRVIVATLAQRLYAFSPSGSLSYEARTPTRIVTGLVFSPRWGLLFGGQDGSVWAYGPRATPLFHVPLGAEIGATPVPIGARTWVATSDGLVLLDGAARRKVVPLEAKVESLSGALPDGSIGVIAGNALLLVGMDGTVRWRRPGVSHATTLGAEVFAIGSGTLLRLSSSGIVLSSAPLGTKPSARPVVAPDGSVYVSGEEGVLTIVPSGGATRSIPLGSSSLHGAVPSPSGHLVIVAAGDGTLSAVAGPS